MSRRATSPTVLLADPRQHAEAVAAIYRPAVEGSVVSFEDVAPTPAEMAMRMRRILPQTPWLVAVDDGQVIGFAYAGPHHQRAGYRWSVNLSAYIAEGWRGRGVGASLYEALLTLLRRQGFVNAYAGVTLPNAPSQRLHEAIGMRLVGVYERVGFKFGAWHDVAWYQLRLADPAGEPAVPIALSELPDLELDLARASA